MAASLFLIDAGVLVSGLARERGRVTERRESLTASLNQLTDDLPVLQKESDGARRAVFDAMDAMDELLNLGRQAGGIPTAQEKFPRAAALMDAARGARASLPGITERILERAGGGREGASALKPLVEGADVGYVEALDRALELMMQTHRIHSEMNALMDRGFSAYEELASLTNDFLTKQRTDFFRNRREAAGWYSIRSEPLVPRIESFKQELESIVNRARKAARQATEAFDRVEDLVRR